MACRGFIGHHTLAGGRYISFAHACNGAGGHCVDIRRAVYHELPLLRSMLGSLQEVYNVADI